MNPAKARITGLQAAPESAPAAGFRIFNRIVDWITNDRTWSIDLTGRVNEVVRKSGICSMPVQVSGI